MSDEKLIDLYLEHKELGEGRSEKTITAYRGHLKNLVAHLAQEGLTLLTAPAGVLERYCGYWLHRRGMRPITRRVPVSAIRGFYAWLHRHGLVAANPARDLPTPHSGKSLPRPMPLDCAERLLMQPGLDGLRNVRDTAILSLLISSGCRVSGVVGLNEEDLLWTRSRTGVERLTLRVCEKGKRERLVPVPLETGLLVRAYLGHPDLARIERRTATGRRVLFVSLRNRRCSEADYHGERRRLSADAIHHLIGQRGGQCGIPREYLHPHALRHLYGTELAEEEVDLIQRQALLGHALPQTTAIYSHLSQRKLRKTVDRANPLAKMGTTPARALALRLMRELSPTNV